jgi:hypothetical protein
LRQWANRFANRSVLRPLFSQAAFWCGYLILRDGLLLIHRLTYLGCPMVVWSTGPDCKMMACVDDGLVHTELLWNTPLHSVRTLLRFVLADAHFHLAQPIHTTSWSTNTHTPCVLPKSRKLATWMN